MSKELIFYRGIERTHWKSTMLDKLNPLREALNLAPRPDPLTKNQYDREAVLALSARDFSELDTNLFTSWFCITGLSNTIKHIVLNCAGCGLVDVDATNNQLVGEVNTHEE